MDKLWIVTIVLVLSPLIAFLFILRGMSELMSLAGDRVFVPDEDYWD